MADEPNEDQLDELEEKIEKVRREAEEHGTIHDPEHEHKRTFAHPDGDPTS